MKRRVFVLFHFLYSLVSFSQDVPATLRFINPVEPNDSNSISISYSTLSYFRDYEYSKGKIQTGYTYFGTWHFPRLAIQPSKNLRIEGGALIQKDFGELDPRTARVMFSVQYKPHKNTTLILGALEGSLAHNLVQPLMGYDRVIERPVEEGFQFKYKSNRITSDLWIDWQVRQERNANYPEELAGGLSFEYKLSKPDNPWQFKIPLQVILPHKGGQLDTTGEEVSTVLNSAIGFIAEKKNNDPSKFLKLFRADGYYVGYKLFHNAKLYPFDSGDGMLLNALFTSKHDVSLLATYWSGKFFAAPFGAPLFQSITSISRNPNYTEPRRQLLSLNLYYDKEIFSKCFVHASVSPYIDLKNGFLENSFAVYFSYRNNFRIGKLKR